MLSGYKTYLTSAIAALTAVAGYLNGTIDLPTLIAALFAAVQASNIRDAISKTISK
jgi:hypothetical protein